MAALLEDLSLSSPLTPLSWLEGLPQLEGLAALPEDLFLPFPLTPLPRLEESPQLEVSRALRDDLFLSFPLTGGGSTALEGSLRQEESP